MTPGRKEDKNSGLQGHAESEQKKPSRDGGILSYKYKEGAFI